VNPAVRRVVAPITGLVTFLAAWELLVRVFDIRPFVLRAPSQILAYLGEQFGDFVAASWTTGWHAAIGLLLGLAVALVLGSAMAAWPFFDEAAAPVLVLVQVTPFVAYIASVVLWLGAGTPPVLFITALVCLPGFAFAVVDGMRSADAASRELFASVDASRWEVLWRLRLPSAMPSVLTAARYNVGLALVATYLVEGGNFADEGLGAIGRRAANLQEADALWATVFCTAVLGTLGLAVVSLTRRWLLAWHVSQRVRRRPT
jgi:NitT/TauT family transport system permease protein